MEVPQADAEEIASDVLFTVHNKIKTFRIGGRAKLTTWIIEIAKNRAIDYLRKQTPEYVELEDSLMGSMSQQRESYAGKNKQYLRWLSDELTKLSEQDRSLLTWRAMGIPYGQLAEWLGTSEGAARVRHLRALKRLIEMGGQIFLEEPCDE